MKYKVGQKVSFYDDYKYRGIGVIIFLDGSGYVVELPKELHGEGWHTNITPTMEDNYWWVHHQSIEHAIIGNKKVV